MQVAQGDVNVMINAKNRILEKVAALVLAAVLAIGAAVLPTGCDGSSSAPVAGPIIDGEEGYHVIVAGGEPEGVAAALSAARNGMKTLLIEKGDALGGLMTLGMLNFLDMNYSRGTTRYMLTRGIFEEFFMSLGNAFDVEEAKEWFMKKCRAEPNITVMLNTEIIAPVMSGNTIIGLEIMESGNTTPRVVYSLAVIDATVDGDVAAAAGAPYTWGGEDYGAHWVKQGVTLVFEVSGVNWKEVTSYLKGNEHATSGADEVSAWGYGKEALSYVSVDGNMRFRGPNIARQRNGNVLLNALVIFGVDALDPQSYAEGIERGRREIPHIIEFMRENFIGFENAAFVDHAPRLYVRETRHFIGEYRLTITDVLENRDHWDRIGHGNYPVDLQPTGPDNYGNIIGLPDIYSIPFRCLVPLEIDQLLITSRSASYDSLPHGSARVIPIGMVAAQAGGTAVAYSVQHGVTFREMAYDPDAVLWLQNQLRKQGAYLAEYEPPRKDFMDHWAYPGLDIVRKFGMTEGGYTNDYRLDSDVAHRWALQVRCNQIMAVVNERTAHRGEFQIPAWEVSLHSDEVTVGQVFLTAGQFASLGDWDWIASSRADTADAVEPMSFASAAEARDYLLMRGVLDTGSLQHFPDLDAISTNGQLFFVLGALYTVLMGS